MKNADILITLNKDCFLISKSLYAHIIKRVREDLVIRINSIFVQKMTNTLEAIILLYEHSLYEQAQALVRILLELRLNCDFFFKLLQSDPAKACQRVMDSFMLEKIKQLKSVAFKGLDLVPTCPSQQDFERIEIEIASRYPAQELRGLKKYGFTGVSIEQRAKITGLEDLYNVVYRNFSRNIHSSDFVEHHMLHGDVMPSHKMEDYFSYRNYVTLDTTLTSSFGIIVPINYVHNCNLNKEIEALGTRIKVIREQATK